MIDDDVHRINCSLLLLGQDRILCQMERLEQEVSMKLEKLVIRRNNAREWNV